MKWFKHFSDNHRGRSVQDLLDKLGHTGLCYYILMEMCADKLEAESDKGVTEADCLFHFHTRVVRQNLRISPANLRRLLDVCAANGLLSFQFSGSSLEISMPILLDLLDRDSKNARKRRAKNAQKPRLEIDIDIDIDKERDIEKKKNLLKAHISQGQKALNAKVWEAYREAYHARYHHDPVRNAKVNSVVSQLAKRLGPEAIDVVRFFVKHNEGYYLKKIHDISACLQDAEALRTQWVRNKPVTAQQVRNFEKTSNLVNLVRDAEEGGF